MFHRGGTEVDSLALARKWWGRALKAEFHPVNPLPWILPYIQNVLTYSNNSDSGHLYWGAL